MKKIYIYSFEHLIYYTVNCNGLLDSMAENLDIELR